MDFSPKANERVFKLKRHRNIIENLIGSFPFLFEALHLLYIKTHKLRTSNHVQKEMDNMNSYQYISKIFTLSVSLKS